jgi:hypothetical protein
VDRLSFLLANLPADRARSCLLALVAYIGSAPEVLWVETYPILSTQNQLAAAITQSGVDDSWPLYEWGLNGTGQIVQVADTGINRTTCFLTDPDGEVPTTSATTGAFDLSRRKVVQYVVWADSQDVFNGHGTHVVSKYHACMPG